jgi:hypothetical protein
MAELINSCGQGEGSLTAGRNVRLTRRSLLVSGAGVTLAAALPRGSLAADAEVGPIMNKLSQYMSEAGNRALPAVVVEETKNHILDTLAAMISGSELPPGRQALQFARAVGGAKIATIVASDILCGPIEAAIVNGALAQADETDDNVSTGGAHPGCAVVPATLAIGEQPGINGTHFLRAVTLGYDIGMRAMKTVLPQPCYRIPTMWWARLVPRRPPAVRQIWMPSTCAGCSTMPPSRREPALPYGNAILRIWRKPSFSAPWAHAMA